MDIKENINLYSISELEKLITILNEKYYNGEEVVDDEIYDNLVDLLKRRKPASKILKKIGAPVRKNVIKIDY